MDSPVYVIALCYTRSFWGLWPSERSGTLNPQRHDSDPWMNWVPGSAHFTLAPRTLGCLPAEASGWLRFGVITLETMRRQVPGWVVPSWEGVCPHDQTIILVLLIINENETTSTKQKHLCRRGSQLSLLPSEQQSYLVCWKYTYICIHTYRHRHTRE